MKAKKLKIRVKTGKFSFPIPALRFSTVRWISKIIIKFCPSETREWRSHRSNENEFRANLLKNMTSEDIDQIIDHLEQEEPFKLVDIESDDEKDGKVVVEIYTI